MTNLQKEYEEYKKFLIEAVDVSQLKPEDKKKFLKNEINNPILKCSPFAPTVEESHLFVENPPENFLEKLIMEANFLATRGEGFITKLSKRELWKQCLLCKGLVYVLHILRIFPERKLGWQLFEFSVNKK